jgi:cell wall assembly regulator SMI1
MCYSISRQFDALKRDRGFSQNNRGQDKRRPERFTINAPGPPRGNWTPPLFLRHYLYPVEEGQQNIVRIELSGNYSDDLAAANAEGGFTEKPFGYSWHHLDYDPVTGDGTLQLVEQGAHEATNPHTGGAGQYKGLQRDGIRMSMEFKYQSVPVDDADIDAVENSFGFKFPDDLRATYKSSNGGRPIRGRLVCDNVTSIVDAFLPIKHSSSPLSTMERSIQRIKIDQRLLPEHLVPFAVDPFGSYFCFSLRESEYGAVYMFRMERWKEPDNQAKLLAPSLTDFLARLM